MTPDDNARPALKSPVFRAGGPSAKAPAEPPTIEVSTLLGGEREVVLVHNGEAYRLRITANNKLILTK